MDVAEGALKNIRINQQDGLEICKLMPRLHYLEYDVDITSCRKQKKYAILYATGPADWYASSTWLTGKLLLKLNNSRLLIFESSDFSLFQSIDVLVTDYDNFLKTKFGQLLAYFYQSGIESLELKYV